jgi:hypothetical protein
MERRLGAQLNRSPIAIAEARGGISSGLAASLAGDVPVSNIQIQEARMRKLSLLPLTLFVVVASTSALADVTQLHVGDKLGRAYLLKPGIHRYTRYTITPDGHRKTIDVWTREISYEMQDGRRSLHIRQQWDEVSPAAVLVQDSFFEPDTLRPLTHINRVTRDGKTLIGGYRFLPDKIVGMDELPDNSRKDFLQTSAEPAYNWVTDMEFLQALPLANGYTVNINFYDPPQKAPARYIYAVTGSDKIAEPDGSTINCWVVAHSFKAEDGSDGFSRYWFAKKTQVLIREEVKTADGNVLVKTLLNPESGDAVLPSA